MSGDRLKFLYRIFIFIAFFIPLLGADKTRVAVMDFEPQQGVDPSLALTASEVFSAELVKYQRFDVIDRKNMDKIMSEQAFQNSGCTDQSCAVELGNMLNVEKMILGNISQIGEQYVITIRLVDVELSQVNFSEKITADTDSEILPAMNELARITSLSIPLAGRVISVDSDGRVLINIGKIDNVSTGQAVRFLREGEVIIDPSTGEMLGRKDIQLGEGKVDAFSGDKLAYIELGRNAEEIQAGDKVEVVELGLTSSRNLTAQSGTSPVTLLKVGGYTLTTGALIMGGLGYWNHLSYTDNLDAYNNGLPGDDFESLRSEVDTSLEKRNLNLLISYSLGGLGLGFLTTAWIMDRNDSRAYYFDGERLMFAYSF